MVIKAFSQVGSGGRKPEVHIKVVSDECGRVRKPRIVSMMVPEDLLVYEPLPDLSAEHTPEACASNPPEPSS